MKQLYICSLEGFSGKSALTLGIALRLKDSGKNVGYFKPLGTVPVFKHGKLIDEDAHSMYEALDESDNLKDICPVLFTSQFVEQVISGEDNTDYKKIVFDSYRKIAQKHDYVIIEGPTGINKGKIIGVSAREFLAKTMAPAILVVKDGNLDSVDQIIDAKGILGNNLSGVVFMSVPENKIDIYKEAVMPYLKKVGIKCFGALPYDRILSSVTVSQIQEALSGKILTASASANNLVETFLVGAMGQERALRFFRKKVNKAVITGGDRADLQMAALETPTRCIILTGNLMPSPSVMGRAEELQVPIVLVEEDTWTTIQRVEKLMGHLSMDKPDQVKQMRLLLDQNFNYDMLDEVWKDN